jgi:hypothetical protein
LDHAANALGVDTVNLRVSPDSVPEFVWDLEENRARLRGADLAVDAAFFRHDVFSSLQDARPQVARHALGWSQSIHGWLHTQERVRVFNRDPASVTNCKPAMLRAARAAGLRIPATRVTNAAGALRGLPPGSHIAKPVAGGDYCYPLEDTLGAFPHGAAVVPMPAIVQQRLVAPEIRIYVIGRRVFAYEMQSPSLDYRLKQDAVVVPVAVPEAESAALRRLVAGVGMDFGAADFKTDPASGALVFLELNTSPMFARFDAASDGELCRAMVAELCGPSGG